MLSSAVAPVQLGVTVGPDTDLSDCQDWFQALDRAGIRHDLVRASAGSGSRTRAERSWHRKGVPLVVGLDRSPGSVVLCSRLPRERAQLSGLPDPRVLRARLDAHDERLYDSALRLLTTTTDQNGHLRTLCERCAADLGPAVFGYVVPVVTGPCEQCGGDHGRKQFISEEGRFY